MIPELSPTVEALELPAKIPESLQPSNELQVVNM
jgi:hypothetical protein